MVSEGIGTRRAIRAGKFWEAYARGRGAAQDYVLAHMWLSLSREGGNPFASGMMELFINEMTGEQLAEAQQMAREWYH